MKVRGAVCMAPVVLSVSVLGIPLWAALGAHEHGVADLSVAVEGRRVDLMLTAPTGDLVGLERAPASQQELESVQERVAALKSGSWFSWDGSCEQVSVDVNLPPVLTRLASAGDQPAGSADGHGHDHKKHDHKKHDHKTHDHSGHKKHGHGDHKKPDRHEHKHDHKHGGHHGHKHDGHTEHAHGDHAHGDHNHGDHIHGDHEADHDHAHFDGIVSWQYRCESGARLRHVDVQLFELLPLERIRAQALSDRGQGAGNLTPRSRRLSLP
ncbi:MAG: DUF2796 domain-containing protein [Gammaproteobacteria bacterium]|jgi:hypothetical protein|nr:DUF2796 domain-containing protein [Gammaproteobacteria bacterium]